MHHVEEACRPVDEADQGRAGRCRAAVEDVAENALTIHEAGEQRGEVGHAASIGVRTDNRRPEPEACG